MGAVLTWAEWASIASFWIVWVQPVLWMYLLRVRNRFFDYALMAGSVAGLLSYFPLRTTWIFARGAFVLFYFYAAMGLVLALYLYYGGWRYTPALSLSALVVFVGSFYWEVPYLVRNAFITGPQTDWFLHLFVVLYVWFLGVAVGWRTDRGSIMLVASGLLVSVLFMAGWPIPVTNVDNIVWVSPYYLSNRAICTAIVFLVVRRDGSKLEGVMR